MSGDKAPGIASCPPSVWRAGCRRVKGELTSADLAGSYKRKLTGRRFKNSFILTLGENALIFGQRFSSYIIPRWNKNGGPPH